MAEEQAVATMRTIGPVVCGFRVAPGGWCRSAGGGRGGAPELEQVVVPHSSFHSAWQARSPRRMNRPPPWTVLTWPKPARWSGGAGRSRPCPARWRAWHASPPAGRRFGTPMACRPCAGLAMAAMAGRRDQQLRRVRDRRHVGDRPVPGVGRQPLDRVADPGSGKSGTDGSQHRGHLLEVIEGVRDAGCVR